MPPFRFTLIGTGNIAGTYVAAMENLECAEIVAVVSRTGERAREFAAEHGIGHAATSLEEVACDYDGVILATPNAEHHAGAIEAASLRKHVLSEKPLDITAENMDRMIAACREAGVKLGCMYPRRTRENSRLLKRLLDHKALGRIYAADMAVKVYRPQSYYDSAAWRGTRAQDGGGPFMQQGSHDIDLLCWLFGRPVTALAETGTFAHGGIDVEDHGAAVLRMPDGAIATIIASTVAKPGWSPRLEVAAEKGTFILDNGIITHWAIDGIEDPNVAPKRPPHSTTTAAVSDTTGHEAILRDFVQAVQEDREPLANGPSARIATDVILAIYRSAEEGRRVKV